MTEDELRAAAAAIGAALADPEAERGSAAALLDRLDQPAAVREAIRARVEVSAADAGGRRRRRRARRPGGVQRRAVARHRGRQPVARARARRAARRRVQLSSPVTRVVVARRRRAVRTAAGELAADAVVVAVPAPLVAAIAFEPPLPRGCRDALARIALRPRREAVRAAARARRRRARSSRSPSATGRGPRAPATTSAGRARVRRLAGRARPARRRGRARSAGSRSSRGCGRTSPLDAGGRRALDVVRRPVGARRLLGPHAGRQRPGARGALRPPRLRRRVHRRPVRGADGGRAAQRRPGRRAVLASEGSA